MLGREIRIRTVNAKKADNETAPATDSLNPETIKLFEQSGIRIITRVAVTVVAAVLAIKIVDTLGDIAIKKTKSADNE